jgi:hypothetical protein
LLLAMDDQTWRPFGVQWFGGSKPMIKKYPDISTFHEKNQGFDCFDPPFFGLKCAAMWRNCTESASQEGNIDKKRKKGFTSSMQEAWFLVCPMTSFQIMALARKGLACA